MKITIITACKNAETTISGCIQSVQQQSHDDVEHWIIDGASDDQTLQQISASGHSAKHLLSEADNGQYEAMNKGLDLATGDIIGFLHADDLYAHQHVLKSVAAAMQDKNLDACYADLTYVDPENIDHVIRYWKSKNYQSGLFLKGWMLPHPTFFVRREIYEKLGNFDTQFTIGADWDLLLRFIEVNKIKTKYVPELWIKMRTGGASNRSLTNIIRNNRQCLKAFGKYDLRPSPLYPFYKLFHRLSQFIFPNLQVSKL
ncbi:MAG: glycosyltransferase [Verrucomicrobia bacterium]|nr:glycosyltransferase [Verrucomicrobiota bacterium]